MTALEGIATAKAEIFEGVEKGGHALINRDDKRWRQLEKGSARDRRRTCLGFRPERTGNLQVDRVAAGCGGFHGQGAAGGRGAHRPHRPARPPHRAERAGGHGRGLIWPGPTWTRSCWRCRACGPARAGAAATGWHIPRSAFTLIDESYNANPASMKAAFDLLDSTPVAEGGRRIAVLGDMLELGKHSQKLHAELGELVAGSKIELVLLAGEEMRALAKSAPEGVEVRHFDAMADLEQAVVKSVGPKKHGRCGQLIKSSNGLGFSRLVGAMVKTIRKPGRQHAPRRRNRRHGRGTESMMLMLCWTGRPVRCSTSFATLLSDRVGADYGCADRLHVRPDDHQFVEDQTRQGQPIRADGPQTHFKKAGTPTMGGLMLLSGILGSTLLWANLGSMLVWVVLMVTLCFGAIGFYDDYMKVSKQSHNGHIRQGAAGAGVSCRRHRGLSHHAVWTAALLLLADLSVRQGFLLNLGIFFVPFAAFVMVGAANAVNLTDGLDGARHRAGDGGRGRLCGHRLPGRQRGSSPTIFRFTTRPVPANCRWCWHPSSAQDWVFYGSTRRPPAIFMGDTGSLAMGGLIGTIAVAAKHEIVLAIIGGLFVVEALSVIIQVTWFKLTGRRVFLMAPIHHHFEKIGWTESQIVIRFWIIAVILALIGLSTLKLR